MPDNDQPHLILNATQDRPPERLTLEFGSAVRAKLNTVKKLADIQDANYPQPGRADVEVLRRALAVYELLLVARGLNQNPVILLPDGTMELIPLEP